MNLIQQLEKEQFEKLSAGKTIPEFGPGDTVIVNVKVVEGDRSRVQAYEGVCIGRSGGGLNESFTVRKISYGEGVERVFPVMSPMINSIKVVRRGKVRRAKLYYLRNLRGKSARIVEKSRARRRRRRVIAARSEIDEKRGVPPRFFVARATSGQFAHRLIVAIDAHHVREQEWFRDQTSLALGIVSRVVIDDRSRLPGRFFGRFATSATSELPRAL